MARERKLSIAMNVGKDEELPKSGRNLSEFINILESDHGEFDLDIQVGVNPVIGTGEDLKEKVVGFLAEYETSEDEEEYEEEDDIGE
jgi:hypothetical protein